MTSTVLPWFPGSAGCADRDIGIDIDATAAAKAGCGAAGRTAIAAAAADRLRDDGAALVAMGEDRHGVGHLHGAALHCRRPDGPPMVTVALTVTLRPNPPAPLQESPPLPPPPTDRLGHDAGGLIALGDDLAAAHEPGLDRHCSSQPAAAAAATDRYAEIDAGPGAQAAGDRNCASAIAAAAADRLRDNAARADRGGIGDDLAHIRRSGIRDQVSICPHGHRSGRSAIAGTAADRHANAGRPVDADA